MKITSMEITSKEFKKVLRGYNVDEVDEFLDKIAETYEALHRENSSLKENIVNFEEKVKHYNKMETTIQNTLLLAQNASDQARENAKKESELILKNANDTAQKVIDKAHSDVIHINDEFEKMKREFSKFRAKFRGFMESQLEMFDDMEKEFVKNYNIGYEISENVNRGTKIKGKEIEIVSSEYSSDSQRNGSEKSDSQTKEDMVVNTDELEEIRNFFVND